MYGIINATVVLPVMMSFATIIYHDKVFEAYLPILIKLTLISSVVHQLSFTFFSSMPYAIGQVQDAGLIFLSAISTSFVTFCQDKGYDDAHILATTTIGLSLCTAFLGCGLLVVGKCKLASYVSYLPTSVVGGYLAYIGERAKRGRKGNSKTQRTEVAKEAWLVEEERLAKVAADLEDEDDESYNRPGRF